MENERKRIKTHQDYQFLDTVSENFRRPARLPAIICGVSVSNVSRVDTERLGGNARCRYVSSRFALQGNRAAGKSTTHLSMWL